MMVAAGVALEGSHVEVFTPRFGLWDDLPLVVLQAHVAILQDRLVIQRDWTRQFTELLPLGSTY
jgi:hypothetical protein